MKKYGMLLMMGMLMLLAGCGSVTDAPTPTASVPVTLSYENTLVSFTEPHGEVYDSRGWAAEHDGVTYSFAGNIAEEDRNEVVNETLAILRHIEYKVGAVPEDCTICVRPDSYLPRVKDHTLYVGVELLRSQEYVTGIAQMLFGNEMPYGLAYALGADVTQVMGYDVETVDVGLTEALSLYDDAPVYLDLNYACFMEHYADGETLPKVKAIALGFYEYLLQNGNTDLYTGFTPEKYRLYLNAFLTANGKGNYDNSDLDGTVLYNGGPKIRLVWENSDGIFYVMDNYTQKYEGGYGEDMVNSGYANLRKTIVDYIAQAAYMREKLQSFDIEITPDPIDVLFIRDETYDKFYGGVYLGDEIRLYGVEGFMHEYCHYLLRDREYGWFQECICNYYSHYPVNEQISPSWYYDMKNTLSLDPDDPEDVEDYQILWATEAHLGREIDWYSMDDYVYQWGAWMIFKDRSLNALTTTDSGLAQKVLFFHYLVGLQGEQDALKAAVHNTPNEIFGKSWGELTSDWKAYMAEEFAWVNSAPAEDGRG